MKQQVVATPRPASPSPATLAGLALVLAAALTAVYWNHFDNAFQFDDAHTIVDNAAITDLARWPTFFTDAATSSSLPTNQAYRPMVTLLNAIDYRIAGGLDPRVFHWHIFLEFLALLALLHFVLLRTFECASGKRHPLAALAGTAFFAFHTATAETLNYVIARSDGFSTLMLLAGFLLYIRTTGWKRQFGLVPLVVGALAKPTALMLAPLVLLFSILFERLPASPDAGSPAPRRNISGLLADAAPYFLVAGLMFWFTRHMDADTWVPGGQSAFDYLVTQPWVIWIYLRTFVVPTGLSADTDLALIPDPFDLRVLWGIAVIAAALAVAWKAAIRRDTRPVSLGILWFFICLAPTSSIIPLAEVMNHHRTFLPYIGLVMAATWCVVLAARRFSGGLRRRRWMYALASALALLAGLHAWGTWQRNEVWHSTESLWLDVTVKSPNNGRGLMNYGLALMGRGDMESAIDYFERARQSSYGNHPYVFVNLAIATNALGRRQGSPELIAEAEGYFRQAVRLGPGYPPTHYFLAEWLIEQGRRQEALPHLRRALELAPAHKGAQQLLERTLGEAREEAAEREAAALRENTAATWLNASLAHYQAGDFERSLDAARSALAIDPGYAPAYNNVCAALNELGDFEEAIAACEQALAIDPDHELARGNLEWAKQGLAGSIDQP